MADVDKLMQMLTEEPFFNGFVENVKELVCSYEVNVNDFENSLTDSLKKSGLDTDLRNAIYHCIQRNPQLLNEEKDQNHTASGDAREINKEPIQYLRKAQGQWERRLQKSLNSMCLEAHTALSRKRNRDEIIEVEEKWNALSMLEADLQHYRPVYSPRDFLEVVTNVKSPQCDESFLDLIHGIIQIPLEIPSLSDIREEFKEIWASSAYLGVEPSLLDENVKILQFRPVEPKL